MEQYDQIKHRLAPAQPHHYLTALGVLPACQGKGFGGALLGRADELAHSHPESQGVALDTEVPDNVTFYQRRGYRVTAEDHLADVPMWFLYRPSE